MTARFASARLRFEPTYKELKPDPRHPDRDEELGFEPTYKELKQLEPLPPEEAIKLF